MVRIPTHRAPTHSCEILLKEFLQPFNLTQRELADEIGVPYQRGNEIVNGKRGITSKYGFKIGQVFKTTPDFWMNRQQRWDLYHAQQGERAVLEQIQPLTTSAS